MKIKILDSEKDTFSEVFLKKNFNYQNLFDIKYYNKINICKVNKVVIDKTILNLPDQDNILPKILHRCKTNKNYIENKALKEAILFFLEVQMITHGNILCKIYYQ